MVKEILAGPILQLFCLSNQTLRNSTFNLECSPPLPPNLRRSKGSFMLSFLYKTPHSNLSLSP